MRLKWIVLGLGVLLFASIVLLLSQALNHPPGSRVHSQVEVTSPQRTTESPPLAESAEALEMLLHVVERDPAFGDAAFHAGLLAIRIGLEAEGRDILTHVGPLMEASPEREEYMNEISRFN